MRMTRPMGEEDRIPRRRCSFFRKRLRVAVCDPWVPGVFSLRDGSDEWAMEAGRVPFHTHTPPGAQVRSEEPTVAYSRRKRLLRLDYVHRRSQLRWKHTHMHIVNLLLASRRNSPTQTASRHDSWLFGFLLSHFGPFLPMLHLSHLSESQKNQQFLDK